MLHLLYHYVIAEEYKIDVMSLTFFRYFQANDLCLTWRFHKDEAKTNTSFSSKNRTESGKGLIRQPSDTVQIDSVLVL